MRMFSRARIGLVLTCVLAATLALDGCAVPAIGAKPTPTPVTAKGALEASSKVTYKDVTFTVTVETAVQGITIKGTGDGLLTTSPKRIEIKLDLPLTILGKTIDVKTHTITDDATKKTYTQTTTNGKTEPWKVTTTDISRGDYASIVGSASSIDSPTLAGEETVNGVVCYHITGTSKGSPVEVWVSKQDFRAEKVTATSTKDSATATITFVFTGYDTGKTITLPTV